MKRRIIVLILFCLVYLQSFSQIDTIYFNKKEGKLIFPTKSIIVDKSKFVVFSPNKKKVAIHTRAINRLDSTSIVKIYNLDGEMREFVVTPIGRMVIGDDGRFVLFGSRPNEGIPVDFKYFLYQSDGKLAYESIESKAITSKVVLDTNLCVICYDDISENHRLKIDVFDNRYKLIGDFLIKGVDFSFGLQLIEILNNNEILIKGYDVDCKKTLFFIVDLKHKKIIERWEE